MNVLSDALKSSAQIQLILNNVMYLVDYYEVDDDSSLSDLLKSVEKNITKLPETDLRAYKKIKNAVARNPYLANLTISHQSKKMGYDTGGLNAAVFTDDMGNVFVAFRGTGPREWVDNGNGLSGLEEYMDTEQQLQALEYFDTVMADLLKDGRFAEKAARGEPFITVSGHSKGGNKAQYITINSEYNYLIDKCFNFDGQGFSPEAIEEFTNRETTGKQETFQQAVEKMYGFNAQNDYVHALGICVIPETHLFYFERVEGHPLDVIHNHYGDAFMDGLGNFSKQTERGAFATFISETSDLLMFLPPELRSLATDSMMSLFHKIMGEGEPIGGEATWENVLMGLPVVLIAVEMTYVKSVIRYQTQEIVEAAKGLAETFQNFGITVGYGFANIGTGLWDIFTSFDAQKIFEGIFKVLWGVVLVIYSIVETIINLIIDAVNFVINKFIKLYNTLGSAVKLVGGIFEQKWGWHSDIVSPVEKLPLPSYSMWETGGFPESGRSFIAREAGPELVGRLKRRTAVVNNDQIVTAVSTGIYGAFRSALNKESPRNVRLYIDGRLIAVA